MVSHGAASNFHGVLGFPRVLSRFHKRDVVHEYKTNAAVRTRHWATAKSNVQEVLHDVNARDRPSWQRDTETKYRRYNNAKNVRPFALRIGTLAEHIIL